MTTTLPAHMETDPPPAPGIRRLEIFAFGLAAAALLVPLVVSPGFLFPFVAPKVFAFRSLAVLLAAVFAVLSLAAPERHRPARSFLDAAVLGFLASAALSTLLGVDVHRSLWDTQERMLGLVTLVHYGAFYFALAAAARGPRAWDLLLALVFLSGGAIVVLGIVQKLDPEFLYNQGASRVSSTLGHPSYLGALGLFLTFGAWLWRGGAPASRPALAVRAGAVLLGLAAISISETRGSLLGLGAGGGALLAWHIVTLRGRPRLRRALAAVLAAVIAMVVAAALLRDTETAARIPGLRRFAGFSLDAPTIRTRILAWNVAWAAWRERPVCGWGPGNYYHAYNRHYDPEVLRFGRQETWVDNAHNVLFNTLVTQGALGLIAYLGLLAAALAAAVQGYRRGRLDVHAAGGAIALLCGQLVHNLFVFESPTSYLHLFFLLALLARAAGAERPPQPERARLRSWPWVAALAGVLAVAAAAGLNLLPARANRLCRGTIAALDEALRIADGVRRGLAASPGVADPRALARDLATGKLQPTAATRIVADSLAAIGADARRALDLYRSAAALGSPHRDGASEAFAEQCLLVAPAFSGLSWSEPLIPLCDLAYDEVKRSLEVHPLDVRQRIRMVNLAIVLLALTGDRSRLEEAEALLGAHVHLSPRRQEVHLQLAAASAALGRGAEALEHGERALALAPGAAEGYIRLADLLARGGQSERARAMLERMRGAGARPDAAQQAALADLERRLAAAEGAPAAAPGSRR